MKRLIIFLTFLFNLTACAHALPYFDSNRLTLSMDIDTENVSVQHKPNSLGVKVLDKFSLESSGLYDGKENILLSEMEQKLEEELMKSIPDGMLYLRFYNEDNFNIVTIVTDEIQAFTSHSHDQPMELVNTEKRYFSIKVPEGLGIFSAQVFLKSKGEEKLLSKLMLNSVKINHKNLDELKSF